ncbi:LysR family transcriptional regulator [Nocardiopsis potens]|uniref:LysR family transcriptional regulator n=1 Tax=Nocardiopsis potens TaxID=1246458 RepID=UPI000346AF99|nr:LysR family transcriptional regulator [Nocardiopsis potens]
MDLRQLEHFVAVVERGGLSRAAEHLFMSQPALSQSIRALERELDVALFHRTGRRLAPTTPGELLLPHAKRVLEDVVALRDAMGRVRTLEEGAISVLCVPEMSAEAVAAWTSRFVAQHPRVRLDIADVSSQAEMLDAVVGGRVELGFALRPAERPDIVFVPLGVQRLLLVRPGKGRAAGEPGAEPGEGRRGVLPLSDIGDLPLVTRHRGDNEAEPDPVLAALREHGADVAIGATVPSRTAQLNFVLGSGFQAFLPLRLALAAHDAGAELIETSPTLEAEFGIVHRAGPLAPASERLIAEVGAALSAWFDDLDARLAAGMSLVEAALAGHADGI